tara:strand:- start:1316 stop:2512 length:1197 start_codon:yes stop_codon:yes gene_type:complete
MTTGGYAQFFNHVLDGSVDTVLELGSRDALDAILMADHFDAHVYAWECNPPAVDICRENIGDNPNVTLVDLACWSSEKTLTFRPVTNGNIGASSVFQANPEYPYETLYQQKEIEVQAVRIEDWWKENVGDTKIDLLAMDLQGAELESLKGMGDLLHDVKYIITEGQHKRLYHDTPLIGDIEEYLADYGFVMMRGVDFNDWFGDFVFGRIGSYEQDGVTYFNHPYNTTMMNERTVEIPLALDFIADHPDYVEVGAVMPYYGHKADTVIDPFDPEATDSRRLAECDLTGKNVLCISTLEHIGLDEYGNENLNTHESYEGFYQIITQAENYLITVPIGYNQDLDGNLEWDLEDISCYGMVRRNALDEPPRWERVNHVNHLAYHYNYPFNAGNFVLVITNKV